MPKTTEHERRTTPLRTSAAITCIGAGLLFHPGVVIEDASAQGLTGPTLQATNIGVTCQQASYSLDELVECISARMPAKDSEGFVPPTATVQGDWRTLVGDLVAIDDIADCDAIELPDALESIYEVFSFHDDFDDQDYCVAMEVLDANDDDVVDRGWGTLIVDPTPERALSIDIPHAIEDDDTNIEGIAIFKGVGAHTFLMTGSNREANEGASTCQSGEHVSDVAHSTQNLFFPAVVEIDEHYTSVAVEHTAIQFHGMKASGCPNVNVYITHGSEDTPAAGDSIVALKNALLAVQPAWSVANPGEPGALCGKNGTNNVEGRYLNTGDESLVCGSDVDTYNGRFIHIEQDPDSDLVTYRDPMTWIEAIEDAFAPLTAPPSTTSLSFQNGVAPSAAYSGTTDAWIDADEPSTNHGSSTVCEADGDEKAATLRWDVSAIPSGSTIDQATITLDVTNATNDLGYYAYALTRDWAEGSATWNDYASALSWQLPGAHGALDRESTPVGKWTPRATGKRTFSLSPSLVQSWLDSPSTNHGILIANDDNSNGVDFRCRETGTAANRPRLTVSYY